MKPILYIVIPLLILLAAFLIPCTNTKNLCGRWLVWREPSIDSFPKYPSIVIANDPQTVYAFPVAETPASISGFTYQAQPLDKFLSANDTVVFIVIQDGAVVYENYFNGAERASQFTAFSITKSYVSALLGIAIEQGHIVSVEEPVSNYVPELAAAGFEQVTIEHLLTMSSGIPFSREKIFGAPAWWSDFYKSSFAPDMRSALLTLELAEPPQTTFTYNNYNPALIGLIIERATGKPLHEFAQGNLWQPLGAEYPATWTIDSEQHKFPRTDGGLNVRAIDLAKFGQLFLNDGNWNGAQLISADWVAQSTTQGNDLLPQSIAQIPNLPTETKDALLAMRYHYLWWGVERGDHSAFYANGDKGQFIYVVPEQNLVIVRTGYSWGAGKGDEHWLNFFYALSNNIKSK